MASSWLVMVIRGRSQSVGRCGARELALSPGRVGLDHLVAFEGLRLASSLGGHSPGEKRRGDSPWEGFFHLPNLGT